MISFMMSDDKLISEPVFYFSVDNGWRRNCFMIGCVNLMISLLRSHLRGRSNRSYLNLTCRKLIDFTTRNVRLTEFRQATFVVGEDSNPRPWVDSRSVRTQTHDHWVGWKECFFFFFFDTANFSRIVQTHTLRTAGLFSG